MNANDNTVKKETKDDDGGFCVLDHVTLGPRQGMYVPLGLFESSIPQPEYAIECEPTASVSTNIATDIKRIEKDDEYQLVYFMQNFTDQTYRVTVKELCT